MCGIAGVLRFESAPPGLAPGLIDRMTDSLTHRGPNDRGTWCDESIALGNRRLSVIDLSTAGRQPMTNEDGSLVITYNGELYNFHELSDRFQLRQKGHQFRSAADTEVLVHLYEELGVGLTRHLNGMFAFALWDARRKLLLLARDPFGVKPLFIQQDRTHFRFGSEIKALLADPAVPRTPDLQALHDYLTFGYIPGTQTAFAGIRKVPPGHWLTITAGGKIESGRFWEASYNEDASLSLEAATSRARELIDQAVRRQLVADVPVGVMLSGGLDSSTLVAMMHRHVKEPIRTYSVGFADASFNELEYARQVSDRFNTVRHEVIVTPERVRALLPRYLTHIDEPYADGAAIPTWYVCEAASKEVVVILSGEGGDESFAGYETYAAYKVARWARRIPSWVRHHVLAPLVNRLPVSHRKLSLEFKLKRFLGGLDLSPAAAHLWWRIIVTEQAKSSLYSPRLRARLADAAPAVRHFNESFDQPGPPNELARLLRLDSTVYLPDDLMVKNDRMSMAHSLEARVPFTDPDLVEFMSRVPARLKLPGLNKKNVMKRALAGVLPESILRKKKMGLEMPYSRWFCDELRDLVEDYLGPERLHATGMFDPEAIGTLVRQHLELRADHGRTLWSLLNYMMWLELYIPGAKWAGD